MTAEYHVLWRARRVEGLKDKNAIRELDEKMGVLEAFLNENHVYVIPSVEFVLLEDEDGADDEYADISGDIQDNDVPDTAELEQVEHPALGRTKEVQGTVAQGVSGGSPTRSEETPVIGRPQLQFDFPDE